MASYTSCLYFLERFSSSSVIQPSTFPPFCLHIFPFVPVNKKEQKNPEAARERGEGREIAFCLVHEMS